MPQEILLDYGFAHLGLNESGRKNKGGENLIGSVSHPIVMTEPFGNPNSCRAGKTSFATDFYSYYFTLNFSNPQRIYNLCF